MKTFNHYRHIRRAAVPNPKSDGVTGKATTTNGKDGGAKHYFELGGEGDVVTSVMLRWFDDATSGTFTLWSTNIPYAEMPAADSDNAEDWFNESATITSPSGAGEGCFVLHIGNSGVRRYRLVYEAADDSEIDILPCGVE